MNKGDGSCQMLGLQATLAQQQPDKLFAEGLRLLKEACFAEALDCFDRVAQARPPGMANVQYARATALVQLQRMDDAEQACRDELAVQQGHQGARSMLVQITIDRLSKEGFEHLEAARPVDGLACFDRLLAICPELPGIHRARARCLFALNKRDDAKEACYKELALNRDDGATKALLRKIILREGFEHLKAYRPSDALAYFDGLLGIDPELPQIHQARAKCFLQLGMWRDAKKACYSALGLQPDDKTTQALLKKAIRCSKGLNKNSAAKANKGERNYPILIYQIGKTAGKTIAASLNHLGLPNHHVHSLSWSKLNSPPDWQAAKQPNPKLRELFRRVRTIIDDKWGRVRWKVITSVREPVARRISERFQNIDKFSPHLTDRSDDKTLNEVIEGLLKYFSGFNGTSDQMGIWYEEQMKEVFGFDVFSVDFRKSVGYQIYKAANADILVLKLEKLSDCCRDAFRDFLGIDDFQLINSNVGAEKPYAPLYKRVLESISVPEADLDRIYASCYCRHFYTEEEISDFKTRWTKNTQRKEWLCTTHTKDMRCLSADGSRSTTATST